MRIVLVPDGRDSQACIEQWSTVCVATGKAFWDDLKMADSGAKPMQGITSIYWIIYTSYFQFNLYITYIFGTTARYLKSSQKVHDAQTTAEAIIFSN